MKYSAVERVNPTISENEYVSVEVQETKTSRKSRRRKDKGSKRKFLDLDIFDVVLGVVTIGVIVSMGFLISGVVKNMTGTMSVVNSILAIL